MITAFLLSIAFDASFKGGTPPRMHQPYASIEECVADAAVRNRREGPEQKGPAASDEAPRLFFCARVVFPD